MFTRFIDSCDIVPVKCKTGIIADGKTGKRLEYISETGKYTPYSGGEKSKYVNQKLVEPIYTYRIRFKSGHLESIVSEATHVSKRGLNWRDVHKAVYDFNRFSFHEDGARSTRYWYNPEKPFLVAENTKNIFTAHDLDCPLSKAFWDMDIKEIPFSNVILSQHPHIQPFELLWLLYSGEYNRIVELQNSFKSQSFGLELEFTGIARGSAAKVISKVFGTEECFVGGGYKKHIIRDNQGRAWIVMRDSSISPKKERTSAPADYYKCEFVTPICTYEDIPTIVKIIKALKKRGMKVNPSCGIHVHVDGKDHTARSLKNLTNIMACKEKLIFTALNVSCSRTARWCKSVNQAFLDDINKDKLLTVRGIEEYWYKENGISSIIHYDISRYHALNLHSLWQGKGVEFRMFNSTTHPGEVKADILLAMAINYQAIKQKRASSVTRSSSDSLTTMRAWMQQLGLTGEEFNAVRHHLTKNLKKSTRRNAA